MSIVGSMYTKQCKMEGVRLKDVLTLKQVGHILSQAVGDDWEHVGTDIKPASTGLSGFLGDHFRVTLHVRRKNSARKVNIFVKRMPVSNKPKASFIEENNYYRREVLMYELFDKLSTNETDTWFAKAYICSENILVMPDLLHQGYRQMPPLGCLDLKHTLLTAASLARFHAVFTNYETKRLLKGHVSFGQHYADLLKDPTFRDSPWLRAAAKLTTNLLKTFSDKWNRYPKDLEQILVKLYIEACVSLTESNSLNVINHKDLWVNNILFKYEGDAPTSALLIDYQCIRYGPPAFDLMVFLYLNTSRSFREKYESMVFRQYFVIFMESLDEVAIDRLKILGYDYNEFLRWCNRARMFGMFEAIGIFPYVLMEPALAQKSFDDPETFMRYCDEDRTEPVVAHAKECEVYKERQLEVSEEFIERYVLKESQP